VRFARSFELVVKEGVGGADDRGAGEIVHVVDNLVAGFLHGGKEGIGLVAMGRGDGSRNAGAEVMDAPG